MECDIRKETRTKRGADGWQGSKVRRWAITVIAGLEQAAKADSGLCGRRKIGRVVSVSFLVGVRQWGKTCGAADVGRARKLAATCGTPSPVLLLP